MRLIEADNIPRGGRCLRPVRPFKAELRIERSGEELRLLKHFAGHAWWSRLWGRLEIRREARAYAALAGLSFVPSAVRQPDADSIRLEYIDGCELIHHPRRFLDAARFTADLEKAVSAMHRRGVVHLDLGGRHNVLVDAGGTLRLIDFAGAWCFRSGSLAARLLMPLLQPIDRGALTKWKQTLLLPLSASEWERASRRRRASRWWLPNRKQRLR